MRETASHTVFLTGPPALLPEFSYGANKARNPLQLTEHALACCPHFGRRTVSSVLFLRMSGNETVYHIRTPHAAPPTEANTAS